MSKNIEYVQSEVVGSEIVETATDSSKLGDLITEAWATQYARSTGLPVAQPAVQVETEVVELKALLLALLRAVWKTPTRLFGGSTLGAAVNNGLGWLRSRLIGDTTYGIPAYPNASVEEAKAVLRRRDMSSGVLFGDTPLPDGMSLVNFLCGYRSQVTELKDDNEWIMSSTFPWSYFPNLTKVQMGCTKTTVGINPPSTTTDLVFPNLVDVDYGIIAQCVASGRVEFPVLKHIRAVYANNYTIKLTGCQKLSMPKLNNVEGVGNCVFCAGSMEEIDWPVFVGIGPMTGTGGWSTLIGEVPNLKVLRFGKLIYTLGQHNAPTSSVLSLGSATKLIHFEIGQGTAINLLINTWSPTMALRTDTDAEDYVDLREDTSLTNNLQQFLANFRKFIILRLADRSASSALTLTLSSAVYNAVTGADSAPASTLTLADLGITSDDLTAKETAAGITTATVYATWLDTYRTAIKWNIAN